ncbi:DUF6192 family protein [Streptomyces sp. NPDC029674]|uniref:DUF6192 family protein n=1 Tax=Streptomyces sp. NPDC029674 TaxID=3365297 RepID=UPI00385131FB
MPPRDDAGAGWGSERELDVVLVELELVAEVGVDGARDKAGRWRHAARFHRPRPDLTPERIPRRMARVRAAADWLEGALEHGEFTLDEQLTQLLKGE